MKVLVSSGSPYSGWERAADVLFDSGVSRALPSEQGDINISNWHSDLLETYEYDVNGIKNFKALMPGKLWQTLASGLFYSNLKQKVWGWKDPRSAYLLDFWHEFDENIYFLLFYTSPQQGITQALMQTKNGYDNLADMTDCWVSYNRELLSFYHRFSDRCILVNTDFCLQQPRKFLRACEDRFSLKLECGQKQLTSLKSDDQDIIAALVVDAYLTERTDTYDLYSELEASATCVDTTKALSSSSISNAVRLDQALQYYKSLTVDVSGKTLLLEEKESNLQRLNQKLEVRQLESSEKAKKVEKLETEVKQLSEAKKEAESDSELTLLQLHQVQEELEHYFLRTQELEKSVDQSKAQVAKTQSELSQFGKRYSDALKVKDKTVQEKEQTLQQKQEAESDAELTLLQLHQVQEELEHYFLRSQELEKQLSESQQHTQNTSVELDKFETRYKALLAEKQELQTASSPEVQTEAKVVELDVQKQGVLDDFVGRYAKQLAASA